MWTAAEGDAAPSQPPPLSGPSMPPALSSQAMAMAASSLQPEEPAAAAGEQGELGKLPWAQRYKQQLVSRAEPVVAGRLLHEQGPTCGCVMQCSWMLCLMLCFVCNTRLLAHLCAPCCRQAAAVPAAAAAAPAALAAAAATQPAPAGAAARQAVNRARRAAASSPSCCPS